jgi:hypothetical protein
MPTSGARRAGNEIALRQLGGAPSAARQRSIIALRGRERSLLDG